MLKPVGKGHKKRNILSAGSNSSTFNVHKYVNVSKEFDDLIKSHKSSYDGQFEIAYKQFPDDD